MTQCMGTCRGLLGGEVALHGERSKAKQSHALCPMMQPAAPLCGCANMRFCRVSWICCDFFLYERDDAQASQHYHLVQLERVHLVQQSVRVSPCFFAQKKKAMRKHPSAHDSHRHLPDARVDKHLFCLQERT
jgi:hypothetical protein